MIKVIGDIKKAQKALGTNVALKKGQMLNGDEKKMKSLCQKHPDLFEWGSDDWAANAKKSYKTKLGGGKKVTRKNNRD